MARILITGSNGYIGNFLSKYFIEKGYYVIGIDLLSHERQRRYKNFIFEQADVRDREKINAIMQKHKPSAVLHCAFLMKPQHDKRFEYDVDVNGSKNVFDAAIAADPVRQFINFSSTSIYGAFPDNPLGITEDHPLRPRDWVYAHHKKAVEEYIFSKKRKNLKVINLRCCTVVGPSYFKEGGVVKAIAKGKLGLLLDSKDTLVQFVHEDDVKSVVELILKDEKTAGTFNLCPDSFAVVRELNQNKVYVPFPRLLFKIAIALLWYLRIIPISPTSANLIAYGIVASPDKLKKHFDYQFGYSTKEAYLDAARSKSDTSSS